MPTRVIIDNTCNPPSPHDSSASLSLWPKNSPIMTPRVGKLIAFRPICRSMLPDEYLDRRTDQLTEIPPENSSDSYSSILVEVVNRAFGLHDSHDSDGSHQSSHKSEQYVLHAVYSSPNSEKASEPRAPSLQEPEKKLKRNKIKLTSTQTPSVVIMTTDSAGNPVKNFVAAAPQNKQVKPLKPLIGSMVKKPVLSLNKREQYLQGTHGHQFSFLELSSRIETVYKEVQKNSQRAAESRIRPVVRPPWRY